MINFEAFKDIVTVSMEDICREIFQEHADSIKIKKEKVVVKNLVTIFNATLKLSNVKGFQAMSVRDLSRETEMSMGALYSYFTGKEELLDMIQEQGRRITFRILIEQIGKESDDWNKLETAVRKHLYLSEALQPWFYFSYMEAKNLSREDQKKAIDGELFTEKIFADILETGTRSGAMAVENCLLTASVIKAMLQDWYLKRWKYLRRRVGVEEYADFIITLLEGVLVRTKNAIAQGGGHGKAR